ncbi:hypothetical protein MIND_01375500 [Mycena indigotica]|uniref:Uncharacterized protein n=1 Tax=Mycena indigotica TaxID=2126181 RepID=A0A8H6RWM4_9AGAR|nr:uncharacterized protein MIND_01375500 [Mycena indigotica]KAF7289145.1 hypothetical protein MIND_01375500 [Mycena indigotica]
MSPSWWVDEATTRGTYTLVSSCVFTLGLCVWTAIHLNIPEPAAGARQFMRKILWLGVGLMAPEIVTFIAWNQYSSAQRVVNQLARSKWKKKTVSIWRSFRKLVGLGGRSEVPDVEINAPLPPFGADWELIHVKRRTLTPDGLLFLAERAPAVMTRISKEDIKDKSKADGLAKLLVALQAGWFCLQCIARGARHLPISLLEITTGAHALYTLFTYLLWAKKPMNISVPTILPAPTMPPSDIPKFQQLCAYMYMCSSLSGKLALKHPNKAVASYMARTPECQWVSVERNAVLSSAVPPATRDGNVVLGRGSSADTLPGTGLRFIRTNDYRFDITRRVLDRKPGLPSDSLYLAPEGVLRWRLAWELVKTDTTLDLKPTEFFVLRSSNVPTYESWEYASKRMILGFTVAEIFYGLIHAAGWNATFSSSWMQLFWRVASCFISGGGLLLGGAFAWAVGETSWYSETFSAVVVVGTFEFVIRMFLLVEAVLNVGALPRGVYLLPNWSVFIPHWG